MVSTKFIAALSALVIFGDCDVGLGMFCKMSCGLVVELFFGLVVELFFGLVVKLLVNTTEFAFLFELEMIKKQLIIKSISKFK